MGNITHDKEMKSEKNNLNLDKGCLIYYLCRLNGKQRSKDIILGFASYNNCECDPCACACRAYSVGMGWSRE